MILQFPDIDTFQLVLSAGMIPPEMSAQPVEVAFDPDGRPSIRMEGEKPKKDVEAILKKLGVRIGKNHYGETVLAVDCWPQVLPLEKSRSAPEVTATTTVLFEVPANELASLVTEMLRLGNDRQSFRAIIGPEGDERFLLKVVGPPYYTLLRAIDPSAGGTVSAFLERSPGIWITAGYDHPMATRIRPSSGQMLLLRPERRWSATADGPFRDIYQIIDVKAVGPPIQHREAKLKSKLTVPLRLAPANSGDSAEMWVVAEDAVDRVDVLVRTTDEQILRRLLFAVTVEPEGKPVVLLRLRPSKQAAPELPIQGATGYRPFWKIPNLYLPVGTRLMPTLRRETVRNLLAEDSARIVRLEPIGDGKFSAISVPDDAFRPMDQWVEYVIDHDRTALQAWMQSAVFRFEEFRSRESTGGPPKPPPAPERARKGKKGSSGSNDPSAGDTAARYVEPPEDFIARQTISGDASNLPVVGRPSAEWAERLRALEEEFLAAPTETSASVRRALWPALARVNGQLNRSSEASLCWANHFWFQDQPTEAEAWEWVQVDDPQVPRIPTAEEFDRRTAESTPSQQQLRALASRVIQTADLSLIPESIKSRRRQIVEYLETHEDQLGVRTAWLAHRSACRWETQPDVLGMIRLHDRLLERLYHHGLHRERDVPAFLRFADMEGGSRLRTTRERTMQIHDRVLHWHHGDPSLAVNLPYVDLMFAFAMASFGERSHRQELEQSALQAMAEQTKSRPNPVAEFLVKAFLFRIENAAQSRPHTMPFPDEFAALLDTVDHGRLPEEIGRRYSIERLLQYCWVLEPNFSPDALAKVGRAGNETAVRIRALESMRSRDSIRPESERLLRTVTTPLEQIAVLIASFRAAPRAGGEFVSLLLERTAPTIRSVAKLQLPPDQMATLVDRIGKLLRLALRSAAHYEFPEHLSGLLNAFFEFVKGRSESEIAKCVVGSAGDCIHGLARFKMPAEGSQFVQEMAGLLLNGRAPSEIRVRSGADWPDRLAALLRLAEGYAVFGMPLAAEPILAEARSAIFDNGKLKSSGATASSAIGPLKLTALVQGYVAAVTQWEPEVALERIDELLSRIERIPNSISTRLHFSLLHLRIVDSIVRGLLGEHFRMGEDARRWMIDDEQVIRHRMSADVRRMRSAAGW